jgi:hypothetical protein
MKANSTISISGGTFTYSGSPQAGFVSVTTTGSQNSSLTYLYAGVAPTVYSAISTPPTDVGTYTVTATLPEDGNFMAAVSTPTPFSIVQATPTISQAPTASSITYGQTLADSNLTGGTASTAGTYAFTTPAASPSAGTANQGVTFTPNDTANYNTATTSVSVTVDKSTPRISQAPTAGSITYGQTLADSNLTGGTASTAGTFAFTTPSTAPSVGTANQGVTFTPSDTTNYSTATTSVSVTVNPTTPTGQTFTNAFGNLSPTNVGADGVAYLMKYALGGTNTNDKVSLPTVALNGSNLTLTAVVRTNDTNVQIVGQWITGLGGTWSNVPTQNVTASANTNSVPNGCQRRDFSMPKDANSRLFLRLKATQTP